MPFGCANKFGDSKVIKTSEIKKIIEQSVGKMQILESGLGPAEVFCLPGAKGRIGFISALSDPDFCTRCNRIRLTANGFLRPCLHSEYQMDLLTPIRSGITDQVLGQLIEQCVAKKPLSHKLSCTQQTKLAKTIAMHKIGG
jgi:cyclic pyranopterin phosphate synthase